MTFPGWSPPSGVESHEQARGGVSVSNRARGVGGRLDVSRLHDRIMELAEGEGYGRDEADRWVLDRVEGGDALIEVARDPRLSGGEWCGVEWGPADVRRTLYRWLKRRTGYGGSADRWERYQAARAGSADVQMERVVEEYDELLAVRGPIDPSRARLVEGKAKFRERLAGRLDRERWGDSAPQTVVQIGELHLSALREAGGVQARVEGRVIEADSRLIEGGEVE